MTVNTLTLYMPGSSVGIQVHEGSQLHLILVSQGANSVPSAPGQTVRADPFPQYIDADELAAALAGVGGTGGGGAVDSVNGQTGTVVLDAAAVGARPDTYIPSVADLPAGSTLTVQKSGGTWPARPTARADVFVQWKGADPSPAIVPSGTGGMIDGVDTRFVTP